MKKLLFFLLVLVPFFGFSQLEGGEWINADTIKKEGVNVFVDHLQNLSTNDSNFVAVNFGTYVDWVDLIGRIDNLDSLGILSTDIQAGEQAINTGTTSITFPGAFDSTDLDISVVPYVRRTSDNAVVDYVVDNITQTGFDVTVWENACYIRYIASQKQPESNNFFETILHESDTATIVIDTTQVRNLQTFVENHSTEGAVNPELELSYLGVPRYPLIIPISTNSLAIIENDSLQTSTFPGTGELTLQSFAYNEGNATTGDFLRYIDFQNVGGIEQSFSLTNCALMDSIKLSRLKYIGGGVTISGLATCQSIDIDSIIYIGNIFSISAIPNLSGCSCKAKFVGSSITLSTLNSTTVIFDSLEICNGTITITLCPNLTKISLKNMVVYGSQLAFSTSNGNIAHIELGTIGTLKSFALQMFCQNQKLSQGSVDSTLALLASLDGTNGTTLFGTGKTVNIGGGTSASPTFTGSSVTQAGSSFVGSTTTCTVTWVGHGYTTGDLLTISGITTLTTANGTFEITVDSPDQFHYTKATGTGTGAGTATIKKAGSTTEGYYYKQLLQVRGATVTTN